MQSALSDLKRIADAQERLATAADATFQKNKSFADVSRGK